MAQLAQQEAADKEADNDDVKAMFVEYEKRVKQFEETGTTAVCHSEMALIIWIAIGALRCCCFSLRYVVHRLSLHSLLLRSMCVGCIRIPRGEQQVLFPFSSIYPSFAVAASLSVFHWLMDKNRGRWMEATSWRDV